MRLEKLKQHLLLENVKKRLFSYTGGRPAKRLGFFGKLSTSIHSKNIYRYHEIQQFQRNKINLFHRSKAANTRHCNTAHGAFKNFTKCSQEERCCQMIYGIFMVWILLSNYKNKLEVNQEKWKDFHKALLLNSKMAVYKQWFQLWSSKYLCKKKKSRLGVEVWRREIYYISK